MYVANASPRLALRHNLAGVDTSPPQAERDSFIEQAEQALEIFLALVRNFDFDTLAARFNSHLSAETLVQCLFNRFEMRRLGRPGHTPPLFSPHLVFRLPHRESIG